MCEDGIDGRADDRGWQIPVNLPGDFRGRAGAAPYRRDNLLFPVRTVREVLMHERSYRGGKRGESESRWPIILDNAVPRLPVDKRKRRGPSRARQSV